MRCEDAADDAGKVEEEEYEDGEDGIYPDEARCQKACDYGHND